MIKNQRVTLFVSYAQIIVFDTALDNPFNDWTVRHTAQGFAWRPGSVSFGTVEEGGVHGITISEKLTLESTPSSTAVRIIDVPFQVPSGGQVGLASISDHAELNLRAGLYQLRYECWQANEPRATKMRLLFCQSEAPLFRIVRADADLHPEQTLLLTTSPA